MARFKKRPVVIEAYQIIQGVKGETYSCRDDIFQLTYEPAE
jgi:hypothetical protein